jgi:hypothetical protein
MKNRRDEDIQKLFTDGQADASGKTDPDFQAYRHLFEALEKAPDFNLSPGFADKVAKKISWRQTVTVFIHQFLLVAVCVVGGIGIGIGVTYYLNTALVTQFFQMANEAKWVIVFAFSLLIIIQFLDKILVRRSGNASSGFL